MDLEDDQPQHYIFVCYSRLDMENVDRVVEELKKRGHHIWMDRTGIVGSQTWRARIVDALTRCQAVVFFGSEASFSSRHVATELTIAEEALKPMVPILMDEAQPAGDMAYFLARLHHLKLTNRDYPQLIGEIHTALCNLDPLGPAPPPPVPAAHRWRPGTGGWIGAAAGLTALALVLCHAFVKEASLGPSSLPDPGKPPASGLRAAAPGGQETPPPPPAAVVSITPEPVVVPALTEIPSVIRPVKPPPDHTAAASPAPVAEPLSAPVLVPIPDPPPEAEADVAWLTKGRKVRVTLPLTGGALLDRQGNRMVLSVSFDNGQVLRISDATGDRIELSDQAMGKGWLKKSLALTHLKPLP